MRRTPRRRLTALVVLPMTIVAIAAGFVAKEQVVTLAELLRPAGLDAEQLVALAGFGIDQVAVTGHRFTTDSDILDALDLPNVRTFAGLDATSALRRIERLPWIESAQIAREYPGVLNVSVRERRPAAIWLRGDVMLLIDAEGRVLGPVGRGQDWPLPRFTGEGANVDAPRLQSILSRQPGIAGAMERAERIAERRWDVVMRNGSRISLAAERESAGLSTLTSSGLLARALERPMTIDLRTPGRVAYRDLTVAAARRSDGTGAKF